MKVLVIGATGTIGREVVKRLGQRFDVLLGGRTTPGLAIDITAPESITAFFEATGPVDAIVCAAGDARFGPMEAMTADDYGIGILSKLMGQVNLTRIGSEFVRDGGSITLTSGVTGRMPIVGTTSISMVNAAIEGFVRAAALELPRAVRINAVSPQWTIETLGLFGMDTSWGVPAERVALGYVESVEGSMSGVVIDSGWRYDAAHSLVSVAVA
jgi:NAD(P)-dependent dehydrogenase (short-subunit alcohol dehydrogenase family)